ncbi:MAG: DUF4390 domain-containing protein [Candidatus Eisenbacteria bacterium]
MRAPIRSGFALRLGVALACALVALAANACSALAVELRALSIAGSGDWIVATVRVEDAFSDRIAQTLDRGMPVTVVVTVEIWQDRAGWFDRLVGEQQVVLRSYRNSWSDDFALRRDREAERIIPDAAALEAEIARPMRVGVLPLARLSAGERYYAIVHVAVKPLTVEDLEAVEKWLSGEAKRSGKPGPGSIARLPSYLVNLLANLSGFGDEVVRWRSGTFTTRSLPVLR